MSKITLPKNALQRVDMGKAFAEHDLIRTSAELFVSTPATLAALSKDNTSCFFVGRRGSGKTAITIEVERKFPRTITIILRYLIYYSCHLNIRNSKILAKDHLSHSDMQSNGLSLVNLLGNGPRIESSIITRHRKLLVRAVANREYRF